MSIGSIIAAASPISLFIFPKQRDVRIIPVILQISLKSIRIGIGRGDDNVLFVAYVFLRGK